MADRNINIKLNSDITEQEVRVNSLTSGENIKTHLGKISKFMSDTQDIAFSSDYKDLKNVPTVNGTQDGILSSTDYTKFNNANKVTYSQSLASSGNTKIGTISIDDVATDIYAPSDTHYTSHLYVNNSTTKTANTTTALTNGNVYLHLLDNTSVRNSHKISGTGIANVKSDTSANIVIDVSSTASGTANGLLSSSDYNALHTLIDASAKAVTGVKGSSETTYRTGNVNITKANIGLSNVENKTSATIRSELTSTNVTNALGYTPINPNQLGVASTDTITGVATLDKDGKVPSSQLPSYVDDVIEYDDSTKFPKTGESGKIYVALDTNKTYRWSGTAYIEISQSLALGETSSTAYRGDKGKIAYDHSQTTGNPHNTTLANLGVNVSATELNYVKGVTSSIQTQLNGKASSSHTHSSYVNQNAFSNIKVGEVTVAADTATDTVTLIAGDNTTITPDATNDTITISSADTHYTSKNVVGSTTATSNTTTALTNGNVYLNSVENGAVTSSHKISGSGATTVTTDTKGNITISSTNTTYTNAKLGQIYGTCSTEASTVAKTVAFTGYELITGSMVSIKFTNGVQANSTLNINSKGAKNIFYKGSAITSGIINAGDIATLIYDGTQYHVIALDKSVEVATTSVNGLMTSAMVTKLNSITDSADSVEFTRNLTSGTKIGTIKINGTGIDLYSTNDTHYSAKNIVGTSNTATSNGAVTGTTGVYLNLIENSAVRSTHKIVGGTGIKVTSDSSGNITIAPTTATATTTGSTKLYTSTGTNTDGTLTQKAIDSNYSLKTHTHTHSSITDWDTAIASLIDENDTITLNCTL